MVEVPGNDPVQLPLPILAALDGRPSHVNRCVFIQPLLPEHRQEGGKEGGGETCEEDSLDLDNSVGRARPLWKGRRRVVSERCAISFVDEDTEEGRSLVVRVGLELGVDLDDEG